MKLNAAITIRRNPQRVIAPAKTAQTKTATHKNGGPTITLKAVRKPADKAKTERKAKTDAPITATQIVPVETFAAPATNNTRQNGAFDLARAAYGETRRMDTSFTPKALDMVA